MSTSSDARVQDGLAQLQILLHSQDKHVDRTRALLSERERRSGVAMRVAQKGMDSGEEEYLQAALERARATSLRSILDDTVKNKPEPAEPDKTAPQWQSSAPSWSTSNSTSKKST